LQPQNQPPAISGKKKYKERVDTNVFQLSMSCLEQKDVQLATGDPVKCSGCSVFFNTYSEMKESEGKQTWTCEFCNVQNAV
jgi:hypothetical protein